MNFCSKCGSTVIPGSNVCPNCGEAMAVMNNAIPQAMEQPVQVQEMPVPVAQPMAPEVPMTPEMLIANAPEVPVMPPMMAPEVPMTPEMPIANAPEVPVMPPMMAPEVPMTPEMPIANAPEVPAMPPMMTPEVSSMPTAEPVVPINSQPVEVPPVPKKEKKEKPQLTQEEKEFKFNKITTITVVVVSIIALVIMGFFMYKALFIKDEDTGNTIKNATQYNYEGFEFFLPEGTIASVEDGLFVVKAEDSSWSAIITIQEGSYNTLVSNKSQISGYFENLGYVSGETEENEVSGMGFVTTEVLIGSQNVLVAYAKASGTKVYGILYTNELATYDNVSLKIVGEILASSISSGDLSSIPAGFTIEMFEQTFEVAR